MQPQYITLPKRALNLTGQRFGRLTALGPIGRNGSCNIIWLCQCDCGQTAQVSTNNLRNLHSQSCGCFSIERTREVSTTHGLSYERIRSIWVNMIQRCTNTNNTRYADYGGRGISVCERWYQSLQAFHQDVSVLPHYGERGYTLDRIDNDGNYEPTNVRWATASQQRRNTRTSRFVTFAGKTQTLWEWSLELGINDETLRSRLERGWDVNRAFTTPARPRKR